MILDIIVCYDGVTMTHFSPNQQIICGHFEKLQSSMTVYHFLLLLIFVIAILLNPQGTD